MYGCIDHTGPNETPEDTEACQSKVLADTKAGAGGSAFLQIKRNIDDDNAKAAEMARLEDEADKEEGEPSSQEDVQLDGKKNGVDEQNAQAALMAHLEAQADKAEGETSFIQLHKNIDDDNAKAAEMARLEDEADKEEGEPSSQEDVQLDGKKNGVDEQNAQAALMAHLEAQADKAEGESS
jgi:hypothetical protein